MFMQRKFPRIDEQWELSYSEIASERFDQSPVASLALNISGGGLCFTSPEAMTEGAMLAMEMRSPQFESPIVALAKVVWCKPKGGGSDHQVGAEFWWVGWKDDDVQEQIRDYIEARAS